MDAVDESILDYEDECGETEEADAEAMDSLDTSELGGPSPEPAVPASLSSLPADSRSATSSVANMSSKLSSISSSEGENLTFGRGSAQCKAARNSDLLCDVTETGAGKDLGCNAKLQQDRTGNLGFSVNGDIKNTFRGSRVCSRGSVVNQTATLSFDPATMICTTCKNEHSIIPIDGSDLVIIVTDQNFVPHLSGNNSCVPVVRLEDPNLNELYLFCVELFERYQLPAGTFFLVGATSFLAQVGSTIYCIEWVKMVKNFTGKWRSCRVGPVPPVLREPTSPATTKLLTELWRWLTVAYGSDISFPSVAWQTLISHLQSNEQVLESASREIYTVALPIGLNSCALIPLKFSSSSSTVITPPFDDSVTLALLRALLTMLNTTFGCNAHPEDILDRELAEQEGTQSATNPPPIVYIGASIGKVVAENLKSKGYSVVVLCEPGWTSTPSNVEKMISKVKKIPDLQHAICIIDGLSNSTYRFEQEDGSSFLPVKLDGRYHLAGKIVSSSKEQIVACLNTLRPLIDLLTGEKIFLSPLPRHLYNPCCASADHCEGIGDDQHAESMCQIALGTKKIVRDHVHARYSKIWVPDYVVSLAETGSASTDLASGLKNLYAMDGVHLTVTGYKKLADVVSGLIEEKVAASLCVSGRGKNSSNPSAKSFYWHGFTSPVGSSRPINMGAFHRNRTAGNPSRKRNPHSGPHFNPYRRDKSGKN
jgi:hypothetical protein